MSKSTRRRSIRLENLQNDSRTNLNQVSRSPKNSPNTQFRNSLLNRNKLDIKFTKVSKPANDSISNQQPQRSIFRTGNLFGLKDMSNRTNQEFPNASNSTTNERVSKMDQDRSNINISCSNSTSNVFKPFSIPEPSSAILDDKNNSDSSATFYEPDSTVDDDLDIDLLFDSNGPIDESVLTKNTSANIPIVSKSSFERVTDYETPKKNLSVKKLTQFNPSTPQKAKTDRKVKPNDRRRSQAKCSQDSLFGEMFSPPQNSSATKVQNSSTKNVQNSTKKVVAASKRPNSNQLSQHRLQTQSLCNPIVNSRSTGKTKPKNSPLVCKNPPTSNLNSKPRTVSPELFASDHDSNQISSNEMVLPSPDDSTQLGHTLVSRNRLETLQDTNSVLTPPVTNPSHQMKNPLRYPLRSTTSSPVIYELPVIHRIRSNSSAALMKTDDSSGKINVTRSKIPIRKPTVPKSALFSQYSSVHGSLLDINTPRDTQTQNDAYDINTLRDTQTQSDVYDFVSNSPPTKPQSRKKRRKGTRWSQKSRTARSTPAKKATQMDPISISSIIAPIIEPILNSSTKKKPQTPKTKTFFNPNAFSDLTNQISRRTRATLSRAANKEGNFLSSLFSRGQLTSSQPSSIFNPSNSQGFRNLTLNSPQTVFNHNTLNRSHRYSQTYGGLLTYIDNINHNNTDTEMDELCDLFKLLKISDLRTHLWTSFQTYRDPGCTEKSYVKRIDKRPQRKISFLGNPFVNYRLSSKPIVEENEPQFAPIPTKSITNGINFRHSDVAVTPLKSNDATEDTNLSARAAIKTISKISLKVPHYFYAEGELNFDGFSDWD